MRPHERLLEALAQSLRSAGFECEVDDHCIKVGPYRYYCGRLRLKTSVEFMGTMYRFTRSTVTPGVDRAVAAVISDLGWRLAQRKRRAEENARLAGKERLEAEARQRREDRVKELAQLIGHTEGFSVDGSIVKFMGTRVRVTDDDYIVTLRCKDLARVMPMLDYIEESDAEPPATVDTRSEEEVEASLKAMREEDGW